MRTPAVVITLIVISTTGTAWTQGWAPPPTRVCEISSYACPDHPQIQATWPARCPLCQAVLSPWRLAPTAVVRPTAVADWREQARERQEELRKRAEWDEKWREQYRHYDSSGLTYPPYVYSYPPPGYHYFPGQAYFYSPNTGLYFFPSTGYYYSPRTGQYFFYNTNTGQYYPALPGYEYFKQRGY